MKKIIQIPEIYACNIPLAKRKIKGPDNWGDKGTIFLRVKKYGATIYSSNNKFGIYLGRMNKRYCIGVYNDNDYNISILETFESISEMKHQWTSD